ARRGDGSVAHASFRDLPRFLAPGDVVVVNTSATLPAALPAGDLALHLSTPAPDGSPHWVVELRDGPHPYLRARGGDVLHLPARPAADRPPCGPTPPPARSAPWGLQWRAGPHPCGRAGGGGVPQPPAGR